MSTLIAFALPGNDAFAKELARLAHCETGSLEAHRFPDGETHLKIGTDVNGRHLALVCTLANPNERILPLLLAADALRELGASRIGLIAPYLAYMRQDRRFLTGEVLTSRLFARMLSRAFDWLVTVDPHLHRYKTLAEIYSIPTRIVHAAPLIAYWIRGNVNDPVIIGPDEESEQWVAEVARDCGARHSVLEKTRLGDRDVKVRVRNEGLLSDGTPVLVDDIISTGNTMTEAIRAIQARSDRSPVCIAVHGIFAEGAYETLKGTGARIVTSNTVPHETNMIDVVPLVAEGFRENDSLLARLPPERQG